jgi:hypothetical protein
MVTVLTAHAASRVLSGLTSQVRVILTPCGGSSVAGAICTVTYKLGYVIGDQRKTSGLVVLQMWSACALRWQLF